MLFGLAVAAVVAGQVLGAVSMRVYTDPSTSMEPTIKTGDRLQVLPGRDVRPATSSSSTGRESAARSSSG